MPITRKKRERNTFPFSILVWAYSSAVESLICNEEAGVRLSLGPQIQKLSLRG